MNPSAIRALSTVVLIAAGLAAAFYLLQSRHASSEGHASGHAASEPVAHEAPEASQADSSESGVITFPEERWKSAGLVVEPASLSALNEEIELTGKIALNEDKLAHIFPMVEGRVDEVKVGFGEHVKKDQLLVIVQSEKVGQGMLQLYQDRLKLEFARVRNDWAQQVKRNTLALIEMMRAGQSVEKIETALKDRTLGDYREQLMTAYLTRSKAQVNQERLAPLSQSGAVAARQIVEAETDLNTSQATLQSLLEQVAQDVSQAARLSEQSVKELETSIVASETSLEILGFDKKQLADVDPTKSGEKLAHYPVIAPFDGVVISKDVVLLERVGPERQILTIADLSSVWVTADVYETHLPLLAQLSDQTVKLHCDAWPGKTFEAQIFYTGDVVQEESRTVALRAKAENAEGLLKPGMFVTVELPNLQASQVVQVPSTAVLTHAGESFVFVQSGPDTFTRRNVTLGRKNLDAVEIRDGLAADEPVVVQGGFALKSRMLSSLLEEE